MDAKDIFLFWKLQFKIIGCAVQKPGEFPSRTAMVKISTDLYFSC